MLGFDPLVDPLMVGMDVFLYEYKSIKNTFLMTCKGY